MDASGERRLTAAQLLRGPAEMTDLRDGLEILQVAQAHTIKKPLNKPPMGAKRRAADNIGKPSGNAGRPEPQPAGPPKGIGQWRAS